MGKNKKKAPPPPSSSSDSSDESSSSSSEEVQVKQPVKKDTKKVTKQETKKKQESSSEDSSEESSSSEAPSKPAAKKSGKAAKKQESSSEESSSEEKLKKGTKAAKKAESSSEDSSSEESSSEEKPKKGAAKKDESSSEESSSEEKPKKNNKRKADDEAEVPAAKKQRTTNGTTSTGNRRVFLGNLAFTIDDAQIREVFKNVGEITDIHWVTDRNTGKFYGTGFVEFATPEAAAAAVAMAGQDVLGRPLRADFAQEKGDRGSQTPRTPREGAAGGRFDRAPTPKPDGCTTVFLGNLSFQIDEDAVRKHFGSCGDISAIRWVERDGQFKGCGFIEFSDSKATDKAVALNGSDLMGRAVRVDYSAPRAPRQ